MKPKWTDEYWLMLMHVYLKDPVGVKPLYSHEMVDMALELHLPPKYLYRKMFRLRSLDTPRLERLWNQYATHPKKLAKGVSILRKMNGFNNAEAFYEGVEVNAAWENDFKPLASHPLLTPIKLILILDLYFRLTPRTMVPETAEIVALSKNIGISPQLMVEVMDEYQVCDPYLRKSHPSDSPLHESCKIIWQRYGNGDPTELASIAAQLIEYYK
jgi:hypothetical protein